MVGSNVSVPIRFKPIFESTALSDSAASLTPIKAFSVVFMEDWSSEAEALGQHSEPLLQ